MKKMIIRNIRVGATEDGIACGPVTGYAVAEACIQDMEDNTVAYFTLVDVEGMPNFYKSDESLFDGIIENDCENESFWNMVEEKSVCSYDNSDDMYESLSNREFCDDTMAFLCKFLYYLICSKKDEIDIMKSISIGKTIGEFDIPVCEAEQDYLDSMED